MEDIVRNGEMLKQVELADHRKDLVGEIVKMESFHDDVGQNLVSGIKILEAEEATAQRSLFVDWNDVPTPCAPQ